MFSNAACHAGWQQHIWWLCQTVRLLVACCQQVASRINEVHFAKAGPKHWHASVTGALIDQSLMQHPGTY